MSEQSEARWARGVRILALVSIAAVVLAVLEGKAIRELRAEVQALRSQRELAKAGVAAQWTLQLSNEVGDAIRWLNGFYGDQVEGLGRTGGLCPDSRLDDRAIVSSIFGTYLTARAAGRPVSEATDAMRQALLKR
jgi:hypothetical protein